MTLLHSHHDLLCVDMLINVANFPGQNQEWEFQNSTKILVSYRWLSL